MKDPKLSRLYSVRFSLDEKQRKDRIWQVLCRHFFQRYVDPQSTVLDLGAGYCEFINHIVSQRRIAFDVDEHVRAHAGPGVEVVQGASTDLRAFQGEAIDVVFASNFFEHLPSKDDLVRTLVEVHRVLRRGGKLLILQPNIRYVSGAYWDFFDHHLPLTERSLVEALEIVGFKPTEVRARFLPFTSKSALPQHPWLVWLYLKVPIAHRVLGGQSWIVAARP
jgi:SAM-dependent methyltransferase